MSDPSLGMVILVAVCSSNCCRVLPPLPRINLWCSRGMLISTLAYKQNRNIAISLSEVCMVEKQSQGGANNLVLPLITQASHF